MIAPASRKDKNRIILSQDTCKVSLGWKTLCTGPAQPGSPLLCPVSLAPPVPGEAEPWSDTMGASEPPACKLLKLGPKKADLGTLAAASSDKRRLLLL